LVGGIVLITGHCTPALSRWDHRRN
jgi:hypothetical protein